MEEVIGNLRQSLQGMMSLNKADAEALSSFREVRQRYMSCVCSRYLGCLSEVEPKICCIDLHKFSVQNGKT